MIDVEAHRRRREAYMEAIGPRAVAIVCSPAEATRNGDVNFPFRQSSDLYYLTGFTEPEAVVVLRPDNVGCRFVMFVRPRDPERETWDGRRAGIDGAQARFGADAAYPISELPARLPDLIANVDDLHFSLGLDVDFDRRLLAVLADLRQSERRGRRSPKRIVDPRVLLHEMRLRKTPEELSILRRAADITCEAHREAMKLAAAGVTEYELEAVINYTFRRRGGAGPGYSTIVGGGDNATILHYIDNCETLRDGDLVLIDAGCEYQFYTADVTRTFPVNGRFSSAQRDLYSVVLSAQEQGIQMTRPGVTIDAIHDRTVEVLTQGMVDLGMLPGPAAERIESGDYKKFYMHRTSHWLGMDVHDVGAYTEDGKARPLSPGNVITIEPGLYIPKDTEGVPVELRGMGIRIEDDVLVVDGGHEVLTSAAPKSIADIERACR
jgi:Xaa-Pro aminopeptidase